jgi:alanine dehydrogenase
VVNTSFSPGTLLLKKKDIASLLTMADALQAVEKAFVLKAEGKTIMPAKIYLDLPQYHGDFRAMPAYVDGGAGMKWVSVYPENTQRYGLPSVMGIIIYCDPHNSYPLAIMDGTYLTTIRTGAAGGVAVKHLARKNSSTVGMVGAGRQARSQLIAIKQVLPSLKEVKVYDRYAQGAGKFAEEMRDELGISIRAVKSVAEAADADIIVTTTFATEPVVLKKHVKPGTHINAIGADAPGKQELEDSLVASARIIVDDIEQASHSGEINVPLSKGTIKQSDIYCTLGEVAAGMKKGRQSESEITLFDSTGLAIQDIICARLVYEKAKSRAADLTSFDFFH